MLYFLFLFLFLLVNLDTNKTKNENIYLLNKYFLIFCIVIYGTSEVLSVLNIFNINFIRFFLIGAICILSTKWRVIILNTKKIIKYFKNNFFNGKIELFFLTLLIISAITYSPNNWDSNTYHLPRIISWLQNGNLDYYPTHIYRQIYQPIFAEINLTWIYSSFGPVSLMNLLQIIYLSFLFSIIYFTFSSTLAKYEIIKEENIKYVFLIIFSLLLQSVTTKNDIVLTYFLWIVFYSLLYTIESNKFSLTFFTFGIIFSILTKGTCYIYLASILFVFSFLFLFKFKHNLFRLKLLLKTNLLNFKNIFVLILAILLLAPVILRNFKLTDNFTGQDATESKMYINEDISVKTMCSNAIKNISLHTIPILPNNVVEEVVMSIHSFFHFRNVNDPKLNFDNLKYKLNTIKIKGFFKSDDVSNFLWFYFNLFCILYLIIYGNRYKVKYLLLFLFLSVFMLMIFSLLLKWQLWHSRLLIPYFLFSSISIISFLEKLNRFFVWFKALILFMAVICIAFNANQPIISVSQLTNTYRRNFHDYYSSLPNSWNNENQYNVVTKYIGSGKNVGIICNLGEVIFPFMYDYRSTGNKYYYVGKINNPTKMIEEKVVIDYLLIDRNLYKSNLKNKLVYSNEKWLLISCDANLSSSY